MKKIIVFSSVAILILVSIPKADAIRNWSEDDIRLLCQSEIAKVQPTNIYQQTQPQDDSRITLLENRIKVLENIVSSIQTNVSAVLNAVVGLLQKLLVR